MTKATEAPYGQRFFAEYEFRGGSISSFSYVHIQAIRRADRETLIKLLRSLGILGQSYAEVQDLRAVEEPEVLARKVLGKQKQAAKAMLIVAVITMFLGLIFQMLGWSSLWMIF